MFAWTLHGGDVAAVPHPRAAQFAKVMKAARDPGKEAELVQKAAGLEEQSEPKQKRVRLQKMQTKPTEALKEINSSVS